MSKRNISKISRYFFNEEYYLVHDENLYGEKDTKAGTTRYAKSLVGELNKTQDHTQKV
jgi:hypothetical protein